MKETLDQNIKKKMEALLKRKKVYNPFSTEQTKDRQIIGGNPSGILNFNDLKYPWTRPLFEKMMANTWFPAEVNMNGDVGDYKMLSDQEREAYDKALSQLIFMDSEQANNLADNINPWVTATEVNACLIRQAWEEVLHSYSYAVMVESISENTNYIFDLWKKDNVLRNKNNKIASVYETFAEEPTEQNIVKSFFANQILEGIYFFSGFTYLYTLARSGKMLNSAQMIRFIQRDEITHLELFRNIIISVYRDKPYLFTKKLEEEVMEMFRQAVDLEAGWGAYITGGQILGLTDDILRQYIEYRADTILYGIREIGFKKLYETKNPIPWVDNFSKINETKANFFETRGAGYSKGSLDW